MPIVSIHATKHGRADSAVQAPCALYRHYRGDALLYVGIAANPAKRLSQHKGSPWFQMITGISINWFDTRAEAEAAERAAIRSECPQFNKEFVAPDAAGYLFLCPEIEAFANEVLAFGERHGFKPSTVLQKSCKNGKTWFAITSGKDMAMGTAYRVRNWMDDFDAGAA